MPNATDIFNAINNVNTSVNNQIGATNTKLDVVNTNLDAIKSATDAVKASVDQMNTTLKAGFAQVITLLQYADLALYQNALQNDTMICDLEKISKNTCDIANEAHLQTALQTSMNKNMAALRAMFAAVHAEAALTLHREHELKEQIEKCCPPKPPDPVCQYSPCPAPKPLGPPPQSDTTTKRQG
jgi:uncharacterized protein YqgV (UPF0045/DUF77 family)